MINNKYNRLAGSVRRWSSSRREVGEVRTRTEGQRSESKNMVGYILYERPNGIRVDDTSEFRSCGVAKRLFDMSGCT